MGELAVARGREDARLCDHHDETERATRRVARPAAHDPRPLRLAGLARGGARRSGRLKAMLAPYDALEAIAGDGAHFTPSRSARGISRPFAHRAVAERQIVEPELVQQEQIDGGRDAAAAIDDRAPIFANPGSRKFGRGVFEHGERLALGINEGRRRDIDTSWNGPSRPKRLGSRPR